MSATYISSLAEELAQIAPRRGQILLGCLLEMAAEKASSLFSLTDRDASCAGAGRQLETDDGSTTEG